MIVAYGDLHISSDRPWSSEVSKRIIDYILSHESNKPDNILILTGDITDKNSVDGTVINLLHSLFEGLRYKKTYICVGNHEGRLKYNKVATTYDFLENPEFKNKLLSPIEIVRELKEIEIEGITTLFLPHIYATGEKSLQDYSKLPKEITGKEYDLIVGHITDSRLSFPSPDKVDITSIKSKKRLMGHIHSGEYFDLGYVGSFVPNSVSETDFPRYQVSVYKKGSDIIIDKTELPKILEYKEVDYPAPLPVQETPIIVWSFTNCADEEVARNFYKVENMYIRKCTYTSQIDKDGFQDLIKGANTVQSFKFYISDWIKSQSAALSKKLIDKIEFYASKI